MAYVGLLKQQRRNNLKSLFLLVSFPLIMLAVLFAIVFVIVMYESKEAGMQDVLYSFVGVAPFVVFIIGVWFAIAYFANTSIINRSTGARPLERRENPQVYNLVENLCISCGMKMPKLYVVDTPELNAYASGINDKTYAVTLTTGIMNVLDQEELEGVISHELTHIRNRDTRLLIISIVFVGIMSVIMQLSARIAYNLMYSSGRKSSNNKNGAAMAVILAVIAVFTAIGYFFTLLTRFAISRKREFMADAGGAELCRNPRALASALRKISANPAMENIAREDVAQLFIFHGRKNSRNFFQKISRDVFSTHPDVNERIRILEQF